MPRAAGEQGDAYDKHTPARPLGPAEAWHDAARDARCHREQEQEQRPILATASKGRGQERQTLSIDSLLTACNTSGYHRIYHANEGICGDIPTTHRHLQG